MQKCSRHAASQSNAVMRSTHTHKFLIGIQHESLSSWSQKSRTLGTWNTGHFVSGEDPSRDVSHRPQNVGRPGKYGMFANRSCWLVGWSLVDHVRELWLNGTSVDAHSYSCPLPKEFSDTIFKLLGSGPQLWNLAHFHWHVVSVETVKCGQQSWTVTSCWHSSLQFVYHTESFYLDLFIIVYKYFAFQWTVCSCIS